jgi:hypothetical protein
MPIARPELLPGRVVRKPVGRRHVVTHAVVGRRVTRKPSFREATRSSPQESTFSAPVFRSAPNFQAEAQPQGASRIKRSTASDFHAWPSPE